MSIFSREAAGKRVKHAEMRMNWRVNCYGFAVYHVVTSRPQDTTSCGRKIPPSISKIILDTYGAF